ncbi:MAG: hypothetical protein WEG36_06040 [Gemmatimonadota bacterium]
MASYKAHRLRASRAVRVAVTFFAAACGAEAGTMPAIESLPVLDVRPAIRVVALGSDAVLHLTLDAESRIYLVEEGQRTVRVLDWSGEVLGRIGEREDGVLQMSLPQDIGWEGDLLWVYDRARYQLHFFDEARLVESVTFGSFDLPGWEFPFIAVGVTPGRKAIALPLIPQWVEGGRATLSYPVVRAEPGGPVLDTLWTEAAGMNELEILWPAGGGTAPVPQPFTESPVRAFVWSDSTLVEVRHELDPQPVIVVERRGMDGSVAFATHIAFDPDPLTEGEITRAVEALGAGWAEVRREPEGEILTLFREALHVPAVRRPYQALVVSQEGRIWIRMTPTAAEGGLGAEPPHQVGVPMESLGGDADGSRWIVLSSEGRPEGQAEFPRRFVPMWIGGSRVVGVTTDDDGAHAVAEIQVSGLP